MDSKSRELDKSHVTTVTGASSFKLGLRGAARTGPAIQQVILIADDGVLSK